MTARRLLGTIAVGIFGVFLVYIGFGLVFLGTEQDKPPCVPYSSNCPILWESGIVSIISGIVILSVLPKLSRPRRPKAPGVQAKAAFPETVSQ